MAGGPGADGTRTGPADFRTDLFRKKRPESLSDTAVADEDDELLRLEDLLPSPDAGPEVLYARNVLLDELEIQFSPSHGRALGAHDP